MLRDRRISLFLEERDTAVLKEALSDVEPLFRLEDIIYTDRFTDGDDYGNEEYRKNFRMILSAIRQRRMLEISFNSRKETRVHHRFIPGTMEYSVKNDKLRLYAVDRRQSERYGKKDILYTINLSRIGEVTETDKFILPDDEPDMDRLITDGYYKEPVTLLIKTERNALERAMLQFAQYRKDTVRISDELYRCEIFYNESNETELLIEGSVLRFCC